VPANHGCDTPAASTAARLALPGGTCGDDLPEDGGSLTFAREPVRLSPFHGLSPQASKGGSLSVSGSDIQPPESLRGRRVALVGKLASMSRREAEQLIRERGGQVVDRIEEEADLVVVADEQAGLRHAAPNSSFGDDVRSRLAAGQLEFVRESDFWGRIGLLDSAKGIQRLYTPAMLAELVRAPVAAIRQWHRRGALVAKREVRRLAYFDFEEVGVARKLAALLAAGCSLSTVNRRLEELARLLPESPRPLADPAVVVKGRRLFVQRGEGLAEPSGQLVLDFDSGRPTAGGHDPGAAAPMAIPFVAALGKGSKSRARGPHPATAEDLRALAEELEEEGREAQAVDVYRAILVSGDFTADDHFALAELLYRRGDLSAARERYYMAIELDEDFVEARSNLGCVLAEQGDVGLAEAAFRGALEYHPDYADAHYHLARLLDRVGRPDEATRHWQLFMSLAPASPWADEARERLATTRSWLGVAGNRGHDDDAAGGLAER
jgi:tetratricopeptide (TPR) repeat protein